MVPQNKKPHAWTQKKNNLDIFGLLETKIDAAHLASIETKLALYYWKYHSNITSSSSCRILVGWN
jgi:hypothetical protein